jgi:hypothetical protein
MPNYTPAEIADRVCDVVARALACDRSRVVPTATLLNGLAATRFDMSHIKVELENAFSIHLGAGDLDQIACGSGNEDTAMTGGQVSEAGLSRLRQLIPEAADKILPGLPLHEVLGLFRVQTLINLVVAAL